MANSKMKLQKAASIATDLPQCMQADKAGSQVCCIMGRNKCDLPLRTGVITIWVQINQMHAFTKKRIFVKMFLKMLLFEATFIYC